MDHEDVETQFRENTQLALAIASRDYGNLPGFDPQEMQQEALIALWRAAKAHQPTAGPFRIYAAVCIRQRLKRVVGTRSKQPLSVYDELTAANVKAKRDPKRQLQAC